VSDSPNPVLSTLEAYASAVRAKDVDAFVEIYADDVQVFDSWGQWRYSGIDAWRGMAAGWFTSLGDETVDVEFTELRVVAGEDVAFGHAAVTFTGISAAGERLRSMTNRFTIGMEKHYGTWSIVHEHTSLPVDLETGQAIFVR
jgi:uncharacterized protein (TIGR02246 family)